MYSFLLTWQVLIVPIIVMIISQLVKVALESSRSGKFAWQQLNSYGGMPSAHTALLTSLVLMIGWTEGFNTPIFAITFMIAAIFIRDAVGIRWQLGFHGKIINRLIRELSAEDRRHFPQKLEERLGHTPAEALAGAIFGVFITILAKLIIL